MSTKNSKGLTNQGFFSLVGGVAFSTSSGSEMVTRMWRTCLTFSAKASAWTAGTQPTRKK